LEEIEDHSLYRKRDAITAETAVSSASMKSMSLLRMLICKEEAEGD
jgi:hypothetical protein